MQIRTLLTLLLLTICSVAYSAELLVQAKDSPFETGAKTGDIIVVRPDGWAWGREEGLPNYVVIKMPGVKVEDVKHYEEQLTEQVERVEPIVYDKGGKVIPSEIGELSVKEPVYETKIVRLRKYSVPVTDVTSLKTANTSVKTVASKSIATYPIATKTLAVEKVAIESAKAEALIAK